MMKLSQMQDIAGCRAVLQNVELAKEYIKKVILKVTLNIKR